MRRRWFAAGALTAAVPLIGLVVVVFTSLHRVAELLAIALDSFWRQRQRELQAGVLRSAEGVQPVAEPLFASGSEAPTGAEGVSKERAVLATRSAEKSDK